TDIVAALLLLDDGCHSDLLVASCALIWSWRRRARSPKRCNPARERDTYFPGPPFRLSVQYGDRDQESNVLLNLSLQKDFISAYEAQRCSHTPLTYASNIIRIRAN